MNGFTEPYWNLGQLQGWALWRDRELVNFARDGRTWGAICTRARMSGLKQQTDELRTTSGLGPKEYRQLTKVFPRPPENEKASLSRLE